MTRLKGEIAQPYRFFGIRGSRLEAYKKTIKSITMDMALNVHIEFMLP